MRPHPFPGRPRRATVRLAALTGVLAGSLALPAAFVSLASPAAAAPAASAVGLSDADKQLLAEAREAGTKRLDVMFVTAVNQTGPLAKKLAAAGSTVSYARPQLGYLRASVPTDKVSAVASFGGLQAVSLSRTVDIKDPDPVEVKREAGITTPLDGLRPPGAGTAKANPYMPIAETGAVDFTAANPTYDGRGVKIGIVDAGTDQVHPALATTTTGLPKVTTWVDTYDPETGDDPTWLNMNTTYKTKNDKKITVKGVTYKTPTNGNWRFNTINERDPRFAEDPNEPAVNNDLNRDGNPAGSSGLFGVLWNYQTGEVRVDTNQNKDFTDDKVLTDYSVKRDVGLFGKDDPKTAILDAVPFSIQELKRPADPANEITKYDAINIGIAAGSHGTHVAGIASANGLFGGAMTGAAPGAQVASYRVCSFLGGCSNAAYVEAFIRASFDDGVDVINMSIGGLGALNDGQTASEVLISRIIKASGVQIFISAGNSGPGINTIGGPSTSNEVVSVGSYTSSLSWRANYGSVTSRRDTMNYYSSRGPREDGGFKPQIVAPGSAVSSTLTWVEGGPVPGTYDLPPGYSMFNGTSMASPQATGAAALLIGAAKAEAVDYSPNRLKQAMFSGARYFSGYTAADEGYGLINVPASFQLLKTAQPVQLSARVEVNTALSEYLSVLGDDGKRVLTPGVGNGIYDREGILAEKGASYIRTYSVTRTTGPAAPTTYTLRWRGNDGTFVTQDSVVLPKGTAVQVPVKIRNSQLGLHAAVLTFDDPASPGIESGTLNVVAEAKQLTASTAYTAETTGTVKRNQTPAHAYIQVPEGTTALKLDLKGSGYFRMIPFDPYGLPAGDGGGYSTSTPTGTSAVITNPLPGTWEVTVEVRRTSSDDAVNFSLNSTLLGVDITPNPDVIPTAAVGETVTRQYSLTNTGGAFTGQAQGGDVGAKRSERPEIANGAQLFKEIVVPAGITRLDVAINNPADLQADLDLYLIGPDGSVVAQSADGDSDESVSLRPADGETTIPAGTYTAFIDGYDVPAGTTAFDYSDALFSPDLGSFTVADAPAVHEPGSTWTVTGQFVVGRQPSDGRGLTSSVDVVAEVQQETAPEKVETVPVVLASAPVSITTVTPAP